MSGCRSCEPVGRRNRGRLRAGPPQGARGRLPLRGKRQVSIGERRTVDDASTLALDAIGDSRRLEIARILSTALVGTGLGLAIGARGRDVGAPGGDHGDALLPRLGREALAPLVKFWLGEP